MEVTCFTYYIQGLHFDEELKGIIPRMMDFIFECISDSSSDNEFSVKASYLEIYNEKIQDLLDRKYILNM